jgi:hypothetical protein
MIYVKRDPAVIPKKVLKAAEQAQQKLETLPKEERAAFIKKKSHVWTAFARYLARMSYGKCWYSESPEAQSFFDVDHYRPKGEAKRSDAEIDDGYEWLAFSWENFRLSAQRSNRLSTNEDSEKTEGKSSWFPLMDGSPKACWDDRCVNDERPVLLDPTIRKDVDLIDVGADGRLCASKLCVGSARLRVKRSCELYGLDLPKLVSARKKVMRDIIDLHDALLKVVAVANAHVRAADDQPIMLLVDQLRRKTLPDSPYSRAARAQLYQLGAADPCAQPEDVPQP